MGTFPPLYCSNCGAANQPQAAFCFACGLPLQAPMVDPAVSTSPSPWSAVSRHLLKERYRLVGQVGTGGMGAVYKAQDTLFADQLVAVKELSQSGLKPQEMVEATGTFKGEAHLLAGLSHPNLPKIHDYFSDAGHWYLVTDFIAGETLETYLNRAPGGHLPVQEALEIGMQLCTVLDYLHTRQPPIIFRDLKPSNVMRTPDGRLYLIDFGIARHFKPGQARDTASFGSAGYAAPEQYGKAQTTPRSDIYSLGALLHQLLSGDDPAQTPFQFAPLNLHGRHARTGLEPLLRQMLDLDANKRPASMAAVRQQLQRFAAQLPGNAPLPLTPSAGRPALLWPLPAVPRQPIYVWNREGELQQAAPGVAPRQVVLPPSAVPSKQGISRRKAIIRLVGLVGLTIAGGGLTWLTATALSKTPYTYRGHSAWVYAVAWSPDSRRIASGSVDQTVQVWDAADGGHVFTYGGHSNYVHAVAWSPDGRRIASGNVNGTVQVWDAADGSHVFTYLGHSGTVLAVAWSPDGRRIASGSDDGTVQVWDAADGGHVYIYQGNSNVVEAVAWSPDSRRIASGNDDDTVQVWQAV